MQLEMYLEGEEGKVALWEATLDKVSLEELEEAEVAATVDEEYDDDDDIFELSELDDCLDYCFDDEGDEIEEAILQALFPNAETPEDIDEEFEHLLSMALG